MQLSDSRTTIVYALYGRANSKELALWQQIWLQGKKFVFVPDQPTGPFAHLYRPVHSGRGKAKKDASDQSEPSAIFRFKTDANMVWAAHAANATYPEADWVLAVDSDTFVFEETLRERVARADTYPRRGFPRGPCAALIHWARRNTQGLAIRLSFGLALRLIQLRLGPQRTY